jgi:hypothetical protein
MALVAPLLGVARAMRGGRSWRAGVEAASRYRNTPDQPFSSSSSAAAIDAEAALYETGELNPRDFGYAHPRLTVEDDKTGDGRGRRVVVGAANGGNSNSAAADGEEVTVGSTLLLARPLAFLDAPEDHQPKPEQLVDQIAMRRLWQTPAAAALQWDHAPPSFAAKAAASGGSKSTTRPPAPALTELAALPAFLTRPAPLDERLANEAEPDAAATSLVAVNAFGDESEDLGASTLRHHRRPPAATTPAGIIAAAAAAAGAPGAGTDHQGGARAVAGVWPAFALLNHSCAPTATHYVCGSTMVVRSTADLSAGDEVTISYLGREAFAPAGERRAALRERYGFECACARCRAEDALPAEVKAAAAAARSAVVGKLRARFEAAVREGDGAEAADVAREVSALLKALEGALEGALGARGGRGSNSADNALAAQAVAYEAYELAYFASALAEASLGVGLADDEEEEDGQQQQPPPPPPQLAHGETADERARRAQAWRGARRAATAALSRCVLVLDGVARGSEVHVLSAHALMRRAAAEARRHKQGGGGERMAEAAAAIVSAAHQARYGASQLPERVALGLLEASRELSDAYF